MRCAFPNPATPCCGGSGFCYSISLIRVFLDILLYIFMIWLSCFQLFNRLQTHCFRFRHNIAPFHSIQLHLCSVQIHQLHSQVLHCFLIFLFISSGSFSFILQQVQWSGLFTCYFQFQWIIIFSRSTLSLSFWKVVCGIENSIHSWHFWNMSLSGVFALL